MSDTPRIEGIPDPRKSSQLSSDDSIDPEKFKRILKVEDADEAPKQDKKKKSKKQEEDEALGEKDGIENEAKEGVFSAMLGENKKKDDPFAIKGVKKSIVETTQNNAELSKSPFELSESIKKNKQKDKTPSLNFEEALPKAFATSRPDISFLKNTSTETSKKDELPTIPIPSTPLNPLSSEAVADEEKAKITSVESESLQLQEEKHKKSEVEKEEAVPTPSTILPVTPPLLTAETPAYANFQSDVYDLFEKMIGLLTIQEYKGISITTIKLSMPGSVFNGCEIKLEHYDTAPHAFNVQLLGNPDAVALFNANFDGLVNSFTQSKYSFQANIRRPILLDTYRSLTKKKGPPTADDDTPTEHAI